MASAGDYNNQKCLKYSSHIMLSQHLLGFMLHIITIQYLCPNEVQISQTFCWNHFMASSRVTRCLLPTTPFACRFFETLYPVQSNHPSIALSSFQCTKNTIKQVLPLLRL